MEYHLVFLTTQTVYALQLLNKSFCFHNIESKATVASHCLQQRSLQPGPEHTDPFYIDKKFKTACVPLSGTHFRCVHQRTCYSIDHKILCKENHDCFLQKTPFRLSLHTF